MSKENKKNKTKEAAQTQTQTQTTALAVANQVGSGPSPEMLALFGNIDPSKLVRRNLPAMTKPGDVPVGGFICGKIVAIVNSPVSTVKGKLLHIATPSGAEFTFPATGVIRNALAPGADADNLQSELEKFVGHNIGLKRLEDKMSDKYKKSMFMFDVFTD